MGAFFSKKANPNANLESNVVAVIERILREQAALHMPNVYSLYIALAKDQNYEQLRSGCNEMINHHRRVGDLLAFEYPDLQTTRDQISEMALLTNPPDLESALRALRTFSENLRFFSFAESRDSNRIESLRVDVLQMLADVATLLNKIISAIRRYKSKQQESASNETLAQYDISQFCDELENLLEQLNGRMTGFVVPPSSATRETLIGILENQQLRIGGESVNGVLYQRSLE